MSHRLRRRLAGVAASLVLLAGCATPAGPDTRVQDAGSATASDTQVLVTGRDGADLELYVVNLAGQLQQLTDNDTDDGQARWSPDGRYIVFTSEPDGNPDLFMLDRRGGDLRRLTRHPAPDIWPSVSPDGTYVLFQSQRDGRQQAYLLELATNTIERLTDSTTGITWAEFSPDGQRVALLEREGTSRLNLVVLDLATRELRALVKRADLNVDRFAWSPDSMQLAVAASVGRASVHLFLVDVASGSLRQLSDAQAHMNTEPVWSADGRALYFVTATPAQVRRQVYVFDPLAAQPARRVSHSGQEEMHLALSADGRWLAVARFDGGNFHTHLIDLDTGGSRRLTHGIPGMELRPQFRPAVRDES